MAFQSFEVPRQQNDVIADVVKCSGRL